VRVKDEKFPPPLNPLPQGAGKYKKNSFFSFLPRGEEIKRRVKLKKRKI